MCLGNQTNNRAESAHRWLKRDLYAGESLLNCCKRIWLSSHQMLVDYLCDVAVSRIRRPVVPFNNPLGSIIHALTRYAAEHTLRDWESSNNPMSVVGVCPNLKVIEVVSCRRFTYKVNLRRRTCCCVFFQLYGMPCRHLVFACMQTKVPLGKIFYVLQQTRIHLDNLLVNSRWLDINLDGVEPPEVEFVQQTHQQPHVSPIVAMMRRAIKLSRSMPAERFQSMLDRMSTVMDAYEITVADNYFTATESVHDDIPSLRERIYNTLNTDLPVAAAMVSRVILTFCTTNRLPHLNVQPR